MGDTLLVARVGWGDIGVGAIGESGGDTSTSIALLDMNSDASLQYSCTRNNKSITASIDTYDVRSCRTSEISFVLFDLSSTVSKTFKVKKSHKIINYFSKYFSIAIPEPKIIKEAKNNLGSISFGYFTITPIGMEKIPSNCNDFAI